MGDHHDGHPAHVPEPAGAPPVGIVTPGVPTPRPGDATVDLQGGPTFVPGSPASGGATVTGTVGTFADDRSHLSGAASGTVGTTGIGATHQVSVTGHTDPTTQIGATTTQSVAVTPTGTTVGGTVGGEVDFGGADADRPAASIVASGGVAASLGTTVQTAGGPVDAGTAPVVTASAAVITNPGGYGGHDNPQLTVAAEGSYRGTFGHGADGSPVRDEAVTGTLSVGGDISLDPHNVVRLGAAASVTRETVTAGGHTDTTTGVTITGGVSGTFGAPHPSEPTSDHTYHVTTGDRSATISGGHDYSGRITEFDREHDRVRLGTPPHQTDMSIREIERGTTQTPAQVEERLAVGRDARIEIDRDGSCYVDQPREHDRARDRTHDRGADAPGR